MTIAELRDLRARLATRTDSRYAVAVRRPRRRDPGFAPALPRLCMCPSCVAASPARAELRAAVQAELAARLAAFDDEHTHQSFGGNGGRTPRNVDRG